MTYRRPKRKCRECGRVRPHEARGLCHGCYRRELRAKNGRYDAATGAGRGGPGVARTQDAVESRIEDYVLIRSDVRNRRDAAARLGVSYRTILRYDARLNEESTR